MKTLRAMLTRFGGLFRRKKLDAEMNEEWRAHLDALVERHAAAGLSPDEARCAAQRSFGGVAQIAERARDERRSAWGEHLLQDLRYAVRQLRRSPGFTAIVVLTLALGLGVTTAIFTVVDAVMWRPLPYAEPHRLVTIERVTEQMARDWRDQQPALERLETHQVRSMVLAGLGEPENVGVGVLSTGMFGLLGRAPALGRDFGAAEAENGNHRVVVISDGFWRRHFGADPAALGRTITLDEQPFVIVGVMPRGFAFPRPNAVLWVPLVRPTTTADLGRRVDLVARLRPGWEVAAARDAINALNLRLNSAGSPDRVAKVDLRPLDHFRANPRERTVMLVVFGAVGCVLLIACANVANLLLVRAAARRREFAVRVALGAGRARLMRQVLTESLLLATSGAALGLLFAYGAAKVIWTLAPSELTFFTVNEVSLSGRVLAFAGGLAGVVTLLCGLAPAWRASRANQNLALSSSSRTATGDRRQHRWQQGFAAAQCALAFVLLVGAGLLVRGFLRLKAVAPGFDAQNLVALSVQLPGSRYPSAESRRNFLQAVRGEMAALPGVAEVALATHIPPRGGGFFFSAAIEVEGRAPEKLGAAEFLPFNSVDENYFRTLRIPLLRGRNFATDDVAGAPRVIIINDGMARRFWPDADPIGQRVRFGSQQPWLTVIGVAGDVKAMGPADENGSLEFYRSQRQDGVGGFASVVARTSGDPRALLPALRQRLLALDPRLPIAGLAVAEDLIAETLATRRFSLAVMGAFAAAALLLAAIGLYGVMAYATAQRTTEIGIRVALGGTPADIVRLVARRGLALTAGGLVVGVAAAAGLTRFLESVLFEIAPLDAPTFAGVALLLALVGVLASLVPARRALKISPIEALRCE